MPVRAASWQLRFPTAVPPRCTLPRFKRTRSKAPLRGGTLDASRSTIRAQVAERTPPIGLRVSQTSTASE